MKPRSLASLLAISLLSLASALGVSNPQTLTYSVNNYQTWRGAVINGNSATGSQTILVALAGVQTPGQPVPFNPLLPAMVPILVDQDAVTPTAVSCGIPVPIGVNAPSNSLLCNITATFAATHGNGSIVSSNDAGVQEAINDAFSHGGGTLVVDGTSVVSETNLTAAVPFPNVAIEDHRKGQVQYYNPAPTNASFLAVPTTLTAVTALPSATPVGAYGTGTYHLCISYVDVMGNEGACSLDFSEAGLATGSFIFTAPAASTGAVGYTIYISLTSGTYALAYKVPLTSSICTLTPVETITAACAVANTNYGQSGSTATVTAITVNTARLAFQLGGASTTSDYSPNSNSHTVYSYVPSMHVGLPGVIAASLPFTGVTAPGTTVPAVVGTVTLPSGFMNYVGRTIRICGLQAEASAGSTSTVTEFEFLWDADGSDAAGVPVILHGARTTSTLPGSAADQWTFCQNLKTTVSGAGVTAGSIQVGAGYLSETSGANGTATAVGWGTAPTVAAATVGSLNLAGEARVQIVYLHTTGTDGAVPTLTDLTVEVVN